MSMIRNYDFLDNRQQVIAIYDKMFPLYIIRGDRNFLIDSGVTTKGHEFYTNIKKVLAATGGSEDDGIQTLVLTHSHWDHVGGSYYLQQQFHFDIYASERTVQVLQKPKAIGFIDRLNQDYKKMLGDTSDRKFDAVENLHPLTEGQRLPVTKDSWLEMIAVPGHTKCSAAYLLHPQRILFPGDSVGVLEQDGSIKPLFLSSYLQYIDSLKKLIPLEAEMLAFSHNRFIKGKEKVATHLRNSLNRTIKLKDQILSTLETRHRDDLKDESTIEQIAEVIYLQEFPKPTLMGPREALMINLKAMVNCIIRECM